VFDTDYYFRVERISDIGNDHADDMAAAGSQAAGDLVGMIVESFHGRTNFGRSAVAHHGSAVDHCGYSGHGNTCQTRDIFHRVHGSGTWNYPDGVVGSFAQRIGLEPAAVAVV